MTVPGLLYAELRRDLGRMLLLIASVALGACTAALVLALQAGVARALASFFPAGDRTLEVLGPSVSFGGLGARLDPAAIARLSALPEVETVVPKMMLRVPALSSYRGAFFGQNLQLTVEIAAEGVPESAVAPDLFAGERFRFEPGAPLPACISPELLAIYNETFAPARGLPRIDARWLRGFELPVTLGASMIGGARGQAEGVTARIVCVSPLALLAGITVPLAAVQAFNKRYGLDGETYSSALAVARHASDVPALSSAIGRLGLTVGEGSPAMARRLGRAVRFAAAALLGLALALLALAGALVAQALTWSIRARAAELRLLEALGATRGFLLREVLLEATVIGFGGGAAGTLLAFLVSLGLAPRLASMAGALPGGLLHFTVLASLAPVGLAVLAAVGGAVLALGAVGTGERSAVDVG